MRGDPREQTERAVASNPFRSLAYARESAGSALTPKLLGTYERELHRVIAATISRKPRHVVNIGCAEGYCAVGLAWRLPEVEVDALDMHPRARELCAVLARLNGVEVRVHSRVLHARRTGAGPYAAQRRHL